MKRENLLRESFHRMAQGCRWLSDWFSKRRWAASLGYVSFGLCMVLFFFYLTFPFAYLESQFIRFLEDKSGCRITTQKRGVYFPLRIVWAGITLACPQAEMPHLDISGIEVKVAPLPLLLHRQGDVQFHVRMGGGEMGGHLTAIRQGAQYLFSLKHEWKHLNLAALGLSGLVNLQGEGAWMEDQPIAGKGRLSFVLEGVRFNEVGWWASPVGEMLFSKIQGGLSWQEGAVRLERFSAEGREVDLHDGSGGLRLLHPISQSEIVLSLRAVPKGALQQFAAVFGIDVGRGPLRLGVKGPLLKPTVSLNGREMPLAS